MRLRYRNDDVTVIGSLQAACYRAVSDRYRPIADPAYFQTHSECFHESWQWDGYMTAVMQCFTARLTYGRYAGGAKNAVGCCFGPPTTVVKMLTPCSDGQTQQVAQQCDRYLVP